MPTYEVDNCPLQHDGESYDLGDPVEMPAKAAKPLLAIGVIKEAAPQQVDTADIVEAIKGLDPDNKDLWMKNKKPQTSALEAVLGRSISAAQRDEAWGMVTKGGSAE